MKSKIFILVLVISTSGTIYPQDAVTVIEKKINIPTYEILPSDPNPIFFNGKSYQGASRRVYPYPMIDGLTDRLITKTYTALILENEYIEACVLPEIGGRIYYLRDKTNDYNFIYYNRVIKPALIGMTGAWISGGVEWNIPHHHRATSFSPIDYKTSENEDGSKTIWVGETELRHRMKWIVGLTLYPGKSFLEAHIKVFNTTPITHSILVWANAATHANENYQITFPPQTQYATFHKKNQFTEWPISHQVYNGADFTRGVDISFWKNHSNSTSFFAWKPKDNFIAGYDHGQQAGTVIFGNEFINPGKKLWSWGNNERGTLWNRVLTDQDGHYIELMFGAFSDNQPDYSWIHPYETKETKMYFMPSRDIPSVKKANKHGFINLEVADRLATLGIYASSIRKGCQVQLMHKGTTLFSQTADIDPDHPFITTLKLKKGLSVTDLTAHFKTKAGDTLLQYSPLPQPRQPMPAPVKAPAAPDKISSADELYYTGLRLEQFHEPQRNAIDYYEYALILNPEHVKSLLRLGINYFNKGLLDKAELYLSKVVNRITWDYTTAEDAEALYHLGLTKLRIGDVPGAKALLYKSSWDYEWYAPAQYQLAILAVKSTDLEQGLIHLDNALSANIKNIDALGTKASVLRHLKKHAAATAVVENALSLDPTNLRAVYENQALKGFKWSEARLDDIAASGAQAYIELAVKYGNEGLYNEAIDILKFCNFSTAPTLSQYPNPIVHYLLGYYHHLAGHTDKIPGFLSKAADLPTAYCFPFRREVEDALKYAISQNHKDAKALTYLGNLIYENEPDQAIAAWEKVITLNHQLPTAHRNLAFAYANYRKDYAQASQQMKHAIKKHPFDPRYYYEQDLYWAAMRAPVAERLEVMEQNAETVLSANSSRIRYAKLLVLAGKYQKALDVMKKYHFRVWEGESGVYDYWLYSHMALANHEIRVGNLNAATELLTNALSKPVTIDVPLSTVEKIVPYFKGLIALQQKKPNIAQKEFTKTTSSVDGKGDMKAFAALAYRQLGNTEKADQIFSELIKRGRQMLEEKEKLDFFNPFAKRTPRNERDARAYYWIALGNLGKGKIENAYEYHGMAKTLNPALMDFVFRIDVIKDKL